MKNGKKNRLFSKERSYKLITICAIICSVIVATVFVIIGKLLGSTEPIFQYSTGIFLGTFWALILADPYYKFIDKLCRNKHISQIIYSLNL